MNIHVITILTVLFQKVVSVTVMKIHAEMPALPSLLLDSF